MTQSSALELYGFSTNDRSGKVRWLAHELGLEVVEHRLDFGDQRSEEYLALNPYASIPTIIWRGETLTESTASCIYLADRFTVADIVAAYSLRLAVGGGLIDFEAISGYLEPLMARAAAKTSEFFASLDQS